MFRPDHRTSLLLLIAFLQPFDVYQIVSRVDIVGIDPHCSFEFFYRLGNSTHLCQGSSQIAVRVGRIWIHAQGLLVMVYCLGGPARQEQGGAQVIVRLGIIRINPQRLLKLFYSL